MANTNSQTQTNLYSYISLALIIFSAVVLIGIQLKLVGWVILAASFGSTFWLLPKIARDLRLIMLSLAILGLTPISTEITGWNMLNLAIMLPLAVMLPHLILRKYYADKTIKFNFDVRRKWSRPEKFYLLTGVIGAYFVLPYYFTSTGAYLNWPSINNWSEAIRLFIGTNGMGTWDEFLFVNTIMALLLRHFTYKVANLAQAIIFTSFLFELGFSSWGWAMIFAFALTQGAVYKRTKSIYFLLCIHLSIDFILYLALIWSHNPSKMPVFL
ncbi:MAG: CPBP family glutamic-type intramembrane protease [Patescibacteria group bacterium]